ncbi:FAD-binding protein [Pseudogemmobacter sp. W21_MBD1_M6]|uniref:FAD-binding protein n=1 Tax=Pseudogemmobacter sp. W21_MBD1_M6 TaxID=3240271 RepID=UPI003F9A53E6
MRPNDEAQMAEAVATATGAVRITGGGTRPVGNPVTGAVLETGGLSGISLYEPGSLTIVAGAGTPLAEIEAALAADNQRLPFEPMDHRGLLGTGGHPTIGGVVAANVSGPRRVQAGACRDYLIGVRYVDGRGTIVKNGGRVMKNVTGYDLVKLMAGSYGTLGVLTEVAFKVLPNVDCTGVLRINGLSDAEAVRALSMAIGSPFEVTGAAHLPVGPDGHPVTMIRIEGFEASVAYRSEKLRALLQGFGDVECGTDPVTGAKDWAQVRDVAAFHGTDGDVWRLSVKPGDGPQIAARLDGAKVVYDWAGGLIWAEVPQGTDVRARLAGFNGHATIIRASAETKTRLGTFQPEPAALAAITAGLRAQFDPRGILNPGLMA